MEPGLIMRQFDPQELNVVSSFLSLNLSEQYRPEVYLDIQRLWPQGFLVIESTLREPVEIIAVAAATFPQPGQVRILLIAVDAEHRRQGLGSRLLFTLMERAQKMGAREACLEVQVGSPALPFYNHHGFSQHRVLPLFYQDGSDGLMLVRQMNMSSP